MIKRKGFTVIELVIAMTVVIVLLGLGTVGFRSSRAHYRDREREADVQAIAAYLEQIYPKEIKNASGKVIKSAGSYPALREETTDTTADMELIFADLDPESLTPPGVTPRRNVPSTPLGGSYIPSQPALTCANANYYFCYDRPNDIVGSISEYIYAPGPSSNDICTKLDSSQPVVTDTYKCRGFSLIYRTEATNKRVVVESKRR